MACDVLLLPTSNYELRFFSFSLKNLRCNFDDHTPEFESANSKL